MKRAFPHFLAAWVILTAGLLSIPAPAPAAEDRRQTFGEAMDWYRTRAGAGDAKAQFYYGLALERGAQGKKGKADRALALSLYRQAAEGGFVLALYRLGVLYQNGEGVEQNPAEARKWFAAAAEAGMREAAFNYAIMLETGSGGARDAKEAARFYEIAASKGVDAALLQLGLLYARGAESVEPDLVEALKWLLLAERAGAGGIADALTAIRDAVDGNGQAQALERADAWRPAPAPAPAE